MSVKTIILISGLILLASTICFGLFITLNVFSGALWGFTNLYFIRQLLSEVLIAKTINLFKIALLTLIKFPILYGLGFGLLYYQSEHLWALLAGFNAALLLCMQKRFWMIFQSHEKAIT